jgi:hypothetical protein
MNYSMRNMSAPNKYPLGSPRLTWVLLVCALVSSGITLGFAFYMWVTMS